MITTEPTLDVRIIEAQLAKDMRARAMRLAQVTFPKQPPVATKVTVVGGVLVDRLPTVPSVADIRTFYDHEVVADEDLALLDALRTAHVANPPASPRILPMR